MRGARALGCESIAWALRRLHCPVNRQALVVDVGSGGNPHWRANVLVDAHEHTRQRHWVPLVADRPTVLGLAENLPFGDGVFDFAVASHVLEHSANPKAILMELQRVARAGYIETPDAFMERLNPYLDHRSEVTVREGRLVIRKKPCWRVDSELSELYEQRAKTVVAGIVIPRHPFAFHVRYYWQDRIDFSVLNPEVDAGWEAPLSRQTEHRPSSLRQKTSGVVLWAARGVLSQRLRNKRLDLLSLLACPQCHSRELAKTAFAIKCGGCGSEYAVRNGVPQMARPV